MLGASQRFFAGGFPGKRSPDLLDRVLDYIRVAYLAGTAETGNGYRLSVTDGFAEFEHPIANSAFIRSVTLPKTLGIRDQCGVTSETPWCNFAPLGRK
jgi:hypothetical protein